MVQWQLLSQDVKRKMKVPSKLISYFEKRIQELECHKSDLEASLKDRSRQLDPRHRETHKSDLIQLQRRDSGDENHSKIYQGWKVDEMSVTPNNNRKRRNDTTF
jgi:hypothetical protein